MPICPELVPTGKGEEASILRMKRSCTKKPPAVAARPTRSVSVLSVDPSPEDQTALARILEGASSNRSGDERWNLAAVATISSAWRVIRERRVSVVFCEKDLQPGSWRDLLDLCAGLPDPPLLIVTSRLADERLWAEALNLGAYDVLAKPFDATEVARVAGLAWLRGRDRREPMVERSPILLAANGS